MDAGRGLTNRVDRLVARGLVEWRVGASDARRRLIRLTPEGKAVIDRAFTARMANEHRLLDELGESTRRARAAPHPLAAVLEGD